MPLPSVRHVLSGWEQPVILEKRIQNVEDGLLVTTIEETRFKAVVQPLSDEKLQFKDIGERSWSWYWLHVRTGLVNLETQDKIVYNNKRFVILSVKDYSAYGYTEAEMILDYS